MKKAEWLVELDNLLVKARKESYQAALDEMINDFEIDELARLELFCEEDDVGHKQELLEMAQRYQGSWGYEKNAHIDSIF